MRRRQVLAAFMLLSSGLIAQTKDPSSSASVPAQEKSDSTKPPAAMGGEVTGEDWNKAASQNGISPGRLIHKVQPKYPKAAKKAHIEGTVIVKADIEKDGTIGYLEAISGPAELIPPAMEAVRKRRYSPYLYKNEPIEVRTEIRVNFSLSQ
jgi:TonB family protein